MEHSSYKVSKEDLVKVNESALAEIDHYFEGITNPVLYILQTHLYAENLLERLLVAELPKGKKLISDGRLTFFQKIKVVESLDIVDGQVIKSLSELNKVRNVLAHKFDHELTSDSIEKFGKPFGDDYINFTNKSESCLFLRLQLVCNHLIASLAGYTKTIEYAVENTHNKQFNKD
jgi:hypothetical protein